MYKTLLEELSVAVPRPKTPLYQNISTIVSTTLSPPDATTRNEADKLRSSITDALSGGDPAVTTTQSPATSSRSTCRRRPGHCAGSATARESGPTAAGAAVSART